MVGMGMGRQRHNRLAGREIERGRKAAKARPRVDHKVEVPAPQDARCWSGRYRGRKARRALSGPARACRRRNQLSIRFHRFHAADSFCSRSPRIHSFSTMDRHDPADFQLVGAPLVASVSCIQFHIAYSKDTRTNFPQGSTDRPGRRRALQHQRLHERQHARSRTGPDVDERGQAAYQRRPLRDERATDVCLLPR